MAGTGAENEAVSLVLKIFPEAIKETAVMANHWPQRTGTDFTGDIVGKAVFKVDNDGLNHF